MASLWKFHSALVPDFLKIARILNMRYLFCIKLYKLILKKDIKELASAKATPMAADTKIMRANRSIPISV